VISRHNNRGCGKASKTHAPPETGASGSLRQVSRDGHEIGPDLVNAFEQRVHQAQVHAAKCRSERWRIVRIPFKLVRFGARTRSAFR